MSCDKKFKEVSFSKYAQTSKIRKKIILYKKIDQVFITAKNLPHFLFCFVKCY